MPRSQRSGEVIEPLVSEQWFVRMEPLAAPALAAVADGRITIMPERFAKTYNNWLENIKVRAAGVRQGTDSGTGPCGCRSDRYELRRKMPKTLKYPNVWFA